MRAMERDSMKLLKHKNNRDIAYDFVQKERGNWLVGIYNINWYCITGEMPFFIDYVYVPINRVNFKHYTAIEFIEEKECL